MKSRNIILKERPVGTPDTKHFGIETTNTADVTDGKVLVRNLSMSVDPYMRGRMIDRASYVPPFQIGEVLTGGAIGRVEESKHVDFKPGDHVESMFGWREAFVASGSDMRNLGALSQPPSAYLGVLGMPGLTAYVGLLDVGALKEGETLFVSGAAGAVGSAVGQIGRIKNCKVIGSVGGVEKASYIKDELGFDHAIDYRSGDLTAQLQSAAPDGIDVYFDNVGGDHLQAALSCMRPFGRIALCGMISQYNNTAPEPGPNNLMMAIGLSLTMRGFIVSNFPQHRANFIRDMNGWIASGQMKYAETKMTGIESAPEAFIGLFKGANRGKMIVELAQ